LSLPTRTFGDGTRALAQRLCAGDARAGAQCGKEADQRSRPERHGRSTASDRRQGHVLAPQACALRRRAAFSNRFVPTYESTVTANLWRDGAVLLGKTNNDEFAMGSSNETSAFGPSSRRGDAAIRSWCRVAPRAARGGRGGISRTGRNRHRYRRLDPSARGVHRHRRAPSRPYGRCSRWGIVAFASSLDQAGPFARSVRDTAILLRSMAGHDPKDTTCVDRPVPDLRGRDRPLGQGYAHRRSAGIRVVGMPAEIERCGKRWGLAQERRRRDVEVSLPHTKYALPAYYIVNPAEASSNLARYDGVRYGLRVPGRERDRHVREDARRRLRQGRCAGA